LEKVVRSLPDGRKIESEKFGLGRGQILFDFCWAIVVLLTKKDGGIWTAQTDLRQIYPASDRLLGV